MLLLLLGVRVLQVSSTPHRTGPVSALAQLGRHVVLGAGPKVWVYAFTHHHSDTLVPISFYDSTFYVTSLRVLKSYVLLSDAFKSVQLLQWREPDLLFKGKDYEDVVPYASHFVVDSPSLGMVVCDHRGNVQVPSSTTSRDAQPSTTDHSSFLLTPPPPLIRCCSTTGRPSSPARATSSCGVPTSTWATAWPSCSRARPTPCPDTAPQALAAACWSSAVRRAAQASSCRWRSASSDDSTRCRSAATPTFPLFPA